MNFSKKPGITIIEIVIGFALVGIVALLIATVFSSQLRFFLTQVTGIGIASENRIAINELTNQTRQAESIVNTCPNNGCRGDTTGPSTVVYRVWALDANGEPTNSAYDYIVVEQDPPTGPNFSPNLVRRVFPDPTLPSTRTAAVDTIISTLAPNGLVISYNNANPTLASQVTFTVATTSSEGGRVQTSTHSAKAKLRNKPTPSQTSQPNVFSNIDDANSSNYWISSMVIAPDGLPVISYQSYTNYDLKVAKCGNPACSSEKPITITPVDTAGTVGEYPVLAVGADNLPVIAYKDGTNARIKVAKCGLPDCSSGNTITPAVGLNGSDIAIALGNDGLPIISYFTLGNNALTVIKCDDPACSPAGNTTTLVDGVGTYNVGEFSSIAIPADGNPVISYHDTTNSNLKVVKCGNPACSTIPIDNNTITTVDNSGDVVNAAAISIDIGSDGLPVVSYGFYNATPSFQVNFIKCGNPACSSGNTTPPTVVDSGLGSGLWYLFYLDMTVAADGLPVISYFKKNTADLKFAKCGTPDCSSDNSITTLDTTGSVGWDNDVDVDSSNRPIISYYDATNHKLKVVKCGSINCVYP